MHFEIRRRHVTIKLSDQSLLKAEVRAEEAQGLWLTTTEDKALPGFPSDVQEPIIFVPFTQMVWMITSSARPPE
ncbi:MAG TPA: hypothetical protein VFC10_17230 [Terriglobia bacterium]|jgi:hypothetical protein|nr:hypothetical protein [Terriglobia bacterium]